MSVTAIGPYEFEAKDRQDFFGGNIVVYLQWQGHLSYCAPLAFAFSPDMPFKDILFGIVPEVYGAHPECGSINWDTATWMLDGEILTPNRDASLAENGVGHKSVLRFFTPELTGIKGAAA